MLQSLIEKFRPWAEAMAGLDDPQGEYLLRLDERVRRLEAKVERLHSTVSADAVVAATPRRAPESE